MVGMIFSCQNDHRCKSGVWSVCGCGAGSGSGRDGGGKV